MSITLVRVSKPRFRTRARSLASSVRREQSFEGFARAQDARRRFAELEREISDKLADINTLFTMPLIYDARVDSVDEFHRDMNIARALVLAEGSIAKLEDLEKWVLTATLSWRIAAECCRLKAARGVYHDNTLIPVEDKLKFSDIVRHYSSNKQAGEAVNGIRKLGFKVPEFVLD